MNSDLDPNTILAAEFDYISQSAFQANEDRAKVTTLYLLTVGSFLVSMLGAQSETLAGAATSLAFAALFLVLSLYAALTLVQLIRLRQSWHGSIVALNRLKEYYIEHNSSLHLENAFEWSASTIPPKFKLWSISFLLAVQIALLGGAALGASVVFFGIAISGLLETWMYLIGGLVAINYVVILMAIYWSRLSERRGSNDD